MVIDCVRVPCVVALTTLTTDGSNPISNWKASIPRSSTLPISMVIVSVSPGTPVRLGKATFTWPIEEDALKRIAPKRTSANLKCCVKFLSMVNPYCLVI